MTSVGPSSPSTLLCSSSMVSKIHAGHSQLHIGVNIHGTQREGGDINEHFLIHTVEAGLIEKFDARYLLSSSYCHKR